MITEKEIVWKPCQGVLCETGKVEWGHMLFQERVGRGDVKHALYKGGLREAVG